MMVQFKPNKRLALRNWLTKVLRRMFGQPDENENIPDRGEQLAKLLEACEGKNVGPPPQMREEYWSRLRLFGPRQRPERRPGPE